MQRLKITLAYDGTNYEGWQIQCCKHRKEPATIQGVLSEIISKMTGTLCRVHGAGRTDAGVHALGQVCHVDVPAKAAQKNWLLALNRQTPPDIKILDVAMVDKTFHAQKNALYKVYAYQIWTEEYKPFPTLQRFCWHCPGIDVTLMENATKYLVGTHDFASLQNAGTKIQSTIRTIYDIKTILASPTANPTQSPSLTITFTGDGFLKQMVRNLVGLLAWIGQGKISAKDILLILEQKKRAALQSPSAPANGLTLQSISYSTWQG